MRNEKRIGTGVTAKEGENFTSVMRRFKRKVDDSGKLDDLRERQYYEKPTAERKRKAGAAKSRWRKKLSKEQLPPKLY